MIIVINAQGKVLAQQNDDLFQGSIKANVIDLVAPFANNVTMYASFELPDGTYHEEEEMKHSIQVINGLNVWKQLVNFPISKNYGIVTMQFRGVIGNQTICTGSVKLPIQKGVPYQREDGLESTQYDELKALISDLRALLGNKVEISNQQFTLANVNEDTVGTYYVYQDETDSYLSVFLPEAFDANLQYYTLEKTGRIINNNKGVYLEFLDGGNKTTLKLTNDGVTINDVKVVTTEKLEESLVAENVEYNNHYTKLGAQNVQDAIDELNTDLGEIKNSQVIDLGTHTLMPSGWALENNMYQYKFKHELFTDAIVQGLIITPNAETINNLNDNDILIYPEIDIEQESEGVAVGIIKADKQPSFSIVANIKLQGATVGAKIEGIKANQIVFVPNDKITSVTVQRAVEEVQGNLDDFKTVYNVEKNSFAKLDVNGKVPSSQLPSYVDDIIECYLHNGAMYLTRTGTGTEDEPYIYTNQVVAVSGKIYVDLQTNKQYRWGGSQYVIISESLALGETSDTAYSGAKGKANAQNISKIISGETIVGKAAVSENSTNSTNSILNFDGTYSGFSKDENGLLKVGDIIIPQYIPMVVTAEPKEGSETLIQYKFNLKSREEFKAGDVIKIELTLSERTAQYIGETGRTFEQTFILEPNPKGGLYASGEGIVCGVGIEGSPSSHDWYYGTMITSNDNKVFRLEVREYLTNGTGLSYYEKVNRAYKVIR